MGHGEEQPCTQLGLDGTWAWGHEDLKLWPRLQSLLHCFSRHSRHPDTKMLHCCVFHKEPSATAGETPGEALKAQPSPLLTAICSTLPELSHFQVLWLFFVSLLDSTVPAVTQILKEMLLRSITQILGGAT